MILKCLFGQRITTLCDGDYTPELIYSCLENDIEALEILKYKLWNYTRGSWNAEFTACKIIDIQIDMDDVIKQINPE